MVWILLRTMPASNLDYLLIVEIWLDWYTRIKTSGVEINEFLHKMARRFRRFHVKINQISNISSSIY